MADFWHFMVTNRQEILDQTVQHIGLTFAALAVAVAIGLPLAISLTRFRRWANPVLGAVGIIQTIPSIALLGFMLPLLGIGALPAIVALFLYALLPIVRNTYAGIDEVDASVVEAARGMGMTSRQILVKVELPLAVPVIFAGIRTATVINVGVATLCALIGAGGLGEYIFRGIALNNSIMILAGALPAALLALLFDYLLGVVQRHIHRMLRPLAYTVAALILIAIPWSLASVFLSSGFSFRAGVPPEFLERPDGFPGLTAYYDFDLPVVQMNADLMYDALKNGRVDVIVGYSTDGRIKAYNLKVLKDDRHYFPPYECAPLLNDQAIRRYPELKAVLNKLAGAISTRQMIDLNNRVDSGNEDAADVATSFLEKQGFRTRVERTGTPDILIGGKLQTEQFIMGHMYETLIENYTALDAGMKPGLAGTQIVFKALQNNELQLYPEYTGTGLYVLLDADSTEVARLQNDPGRVFDYVKQQSERRFNLTWLKPIGFENTYALMMRKEQAEQLHIDTITDLVAYLRQQDTSP